MKRIVVIPDLPGEGWRSMDLYAARLRRFLPQFLPDAQLAFPDASFRELFSDGSLEAPAPRYLDRYLTYPRVTRAHRGDVYHVLDHSYGHLVAGLDPGRCVITLHDLYPLQVIEAASRGLRASVRRRFLERTMMHAFRAARIIVNSRFIRNELLDRTGFPEERLHLIPLGVDPVYFEARSAEDLTEFRKRLDIRESDAIILHIGSCDPRKGIETLLRAMSKLPREGAARVTLVQVGGRVTPGLMNLAAALNLEDRFVPAGAVDSEDLIRALKTASALVCPSTYEGFGLPVLEAMAAGTPVIVSLKGPMIELSGEDGLAAEAGDPGSFADAILDVLTHPHAAHARAERARRRAVSYTWENTARQTADVYRELYDGSA